MSVSDEQFLLVGVVLALLVVPGVVAGAGEVTVGNTTGEQGETVTVPIVVNGSDVASYETEITFDPSALTVSAVSGGDFAEPIVNVDNENGSLRLTQTQLDGIEDPILANVTVRLDGPGGTNATLAVVPDATKVFTSDGEELAFTAFSDGRISILAVEETTTTAATTDEHTTTQPVRASTTQVSEDSTEASTTSRESTTVQATTTTIGPDGEPEEDDDRSMLLLSLAGIGGLSLIAMAVLAVRRLRSDDSTSPLDY